MISHCRPTHPFGRMLASICGRMTVDYKREVALALTGWRSLFQPDLVVVEGRAADRRDRFSAGQRIDAPAADMVAVRMDRFRDEHAAADAIQQPRDQRRFAPGVAEYHCITIGNVE